MGLAVGNCRFSLVNCDWECVAGVCATCRCFGGLATTFAVQLSASSTAVTLGSEIFTLVFGLATLGFGLATLGFGSAILGNGVAWRVSGWVCNRFYCSFAFAAEAFANANFVNSLLTLRSASAALVSGGTCPCRALVSHCRAWMTIVWEDTLGFVMYWSLKNTALLIFIVLILTI